MDFLNTGIPMGRWFGINVRLHFTFFLYAYWRLKDSDNLAFGIAFLVGLYVCILLHEFGHALAAQWCDGEASDILLWPLGGLAFVRPAFHPTAHLITTVAGPFVTLVLWLLFSGLSWVLRSFVSDPTELFVYLYNFVLAMKGLNLILLLFNLIPAFPMDGGRILRDTLWHWMSVETATKIAVTISQVIAVGGIGWAIYSHQYMLILLAGFILMQAVREKQIVGFEAVGTYSFSLRERLRRGNRQRAFRKTASEGTEAFHRCATCHRTEDDLPTQEFRVCSDCSHGEEYCQEHLETHSHL